MYFRQPAYFSDFRCVGGDCIFTCCKDWRIGFKKENLENLLSAPNISNELQSKLNNSFKESDVENYDYVIKFNDKRNCPLMDENGLCLIHKELGEDYLLPICRTYPRAHRMALDSQTKENSFLYRFCHLSCPEVAKRLITDKKAMNLVNVLPKRKMTLEFVESIDDDSLQNYPELQFSVELNEFFYNLFSEKKYPLETAVFYGAIAANILTDMIEQKQYSSVPSVLKEMREGFSKGDMLREFEKITPDYKIKYGFVAGIISKNISKSTLDTLDNGNGKLSVAAYEHGEEKIKQVFDGDDFWLRNIALNLLLELSVPFHLIGYTIWENYSLFVLALACIKLNAISAMAPDSETLEMFYSSELSVKLSGLERIYGFTSLVCRDICQNQDAEKLLISSLKDAKLTTPGQLALLIK